MNAKPRRLSRDFWILVAVLCVGTPWEAQSQTFVFNEQSVKKAMRDVVPDSAECTSSNYGMVPAQCLIKNGNEEEFIIKWIRIESDNSLRIGVMAGRNNARECIDKYLPIALRFQQLLGFSAAEVRPCVAAASENLANFWGNQRTDNNKPEAQVVHSDKGTVLKMTCGYGGDSAVNITTSFERSNKF